MRPFAAQVDLSVVIPTPTIHSQVIRYVAGLLLLARLVGLTAGLPASTHHTADFCAGTRPKPKSIPEVIPRVTAPNDAAAAAVPDGSFSIFNWNGYPGNRPRPTGPFRLIEGAEYDAARAAVNQANRAMHQADPALRGLQIHELQPVNFGGSPTDPLNKIPLTPQQNAPATARWNGVQRKIEGR